MSEEPIQPSGPIEGASRVLRELLRTPGFKKAVRTLITELDPENTALLVRTLMWEDPEFFLGLMGAAPSITGACRRRRSAARRRDGTLREFARTSARSGQTRGARGVHGRAD